MMTKKEAKNFIESFKKLRNLVTDEISLQVSNLYPVWKSDNAYIVGERVLYEGTLYKVLLDHISQIDWTPDNSPSLFTKILIPDENIIPEWIQPDSTNTYSMNDKVKHNGYIWISVVDNNSWEPGVYGWEKIIN